MYSGGELSAKNLATIRKIYEKIELAEDEEKSRKKEEESEPSDKKESDEKELSEEQKKESAEKEFSERSSKFFSEAIKPLEDRMCALEETHSKILELMEKKK